MKNFISILTVTLLTACGESNVKDNSNAEVKDLKSDNKASVEVALGQCRNELQAAASAPQLRDTGKSKRDLAAILPPRESNNKMAKIMWSVLDDIYESPQISAGTYFTYRSEMCIRRNFGEKNPASLKIIEPLLLSCQEKYEPKTDEHINCVRKSIIVGADAN